MKLNRRQLQAALDGLAAAHNRAEIHRTRIAEHCSAVYGADPADIDNDQFIDSCDGGAGRCCGMSVAEFEDSMAECLELERKRK
jgi:hypothetical protein